MKSREIRFSDAIRYAQKRTYDRELTWGEARKLMGGTAVGYSITAAVMFTDGTAFVATRQNVGDRITYFVVEKGE